MSDVTNDKSPAQLLGEAGALLACWALALPDDDRRVDQEGGAGMLQASMAAIAWLLRGIDNVVSEPPQLVMDIQQASALAQMIDQALWRLTTTPKLGEQLSSADLRNACSRVRDHVIGAAATLDGLQVHAPDAIAVDMAWARHRRQAGARA